MRSLKIRVFKGRGEKPHTVLTIPLPVARLAARLLPRSLTAELERQGWEVREFLARITRENLRGPLMELEKGGERTVISVE